MLLHEGGFPRCGLQTPSLFRIPLQTHGWQCYSKFECFPGQGIWARRHMGSIPEEMRKPKQLRSYGYVLYRSAAASTLGIGRSLQEPKIGFFLIITTTKKPSGVFKGQPQRPQIRNFIVPRSGCNSNKKPSSKKPLNRDSARHIAHSKTSIEGPQAVGMRNMTAAESASGHSNHITLVMRRWQRTSRTTWQGLGGTSLTRTTKSTYLGPEAVTTSHAQRYRRRIAMATEILHDHQYAYYQACSQTAVNPSSSQNSDGQLEAGYQALGGSTAPLRSAPGRRLRRFKIKRRLRYGSQAPMNPWPLQGTGEFQVSG